MNVNILKRNTIRKSIPHHCHPGHPEENNIETRNKNIIWIPFFKIRIICIWPTQENKFVDNKLDNSFQQLFEIIRLIRNLRAELGLKPSEKVPVYLISDNDELIDFLKILVDDIQTLTKSSEVFIFKTNAVDKKEFAKSFSGIISDLEVYLPFQDFVNIDALKERLNKDLKKVTIELDNLNKRLSNKNFVDKAPKDIVDECRFKLNEGSVQMERITKKLELLN